MSKLAWEVASVPMWLSGTFSLIMSISILFAPVERPHALIYKVLDFCTGTVLGTFMVAVAMWMCGL